MRVRTIWLVKVLSWDRYIAASCSILAKQLVDDVPTTDVKKMMIRVSLEAGSRLHHAIALRHRPN